MRVVEISENKLNKMADITEDVLMSMGQLMSCISRLSDEMFGERRGDNMTDRYMRNSGMYNRYGNMGDHNGDREFENMMNERRRSRRMMN